MLNWRQQTQGRCRLLRPSLGEYARGPPQQWLRLHFPLDFEDGKNDLAYALPCRWWASPPTI